MLIYFKKFFTLIDTDKINFILIMFLSLFVSTMDAIGILSILPVVLIITDFESFKSIILALEFKILNNILDNPRSTVIIYFSLFSIFFFSLKIISSIFIQFILNKFAYSKMFNLRSRILKKILKLNYLNFQKLNKNETLNIILTTVHEFIELSLRPFLRIFSESMILIILISVLIVTDINMTLIIIIFLSLLSLLYYVSIRKVIYKYGTISDNENIKTIDSATNNINGFIDLRILKLTNSFFNVYINHINNYSSTKTKSVTIESIPRYLFEFSIFILLNLIIIFYTFYDDYNFIINNISLLAIISIRILPSVSIISSSLVALRFSTYHQNKLYNFTTDLNYLDDQLIENKSLFMDSFKNLKIKNLVFRYNNNVIFDNVNFSINKNEFIGLIGSSGVGKSTFIKIISQILSPKNGSIYINEQNTHNIDFQNKICLVSQNNFFINGSIKQNISLNVDSDIIDDKKIINLLKEVNLYEELITSNRSIYSQISNDASELSGGQKQRLIIARSLYFDREFFIFDEAASSLDVENTKSVINTLLKLKNKITLIYVSHNLKSLLFCDKIYEIKNSSIERYKSKLT